MGFALEPVSAYADLLAACDGDDFVRWSLDPAQPVCGWAFDGGVALLRVGLRRTSLTVVSTPEAAARALPALRELAPEAHTTTLPLGTLDVGGPDGAAVHAIVDAAAGNDWEWMRTSDVPPAHPLAGRVRDLGPAWDAAVSELLAASNPRASTAPGDSDVVTWHGVPDGDGRLLACGAHTEAVPGVPHLASIATRPSARGQGLGEAVTASLTRAALEAGRPVVTLGMYADNAVARRLYRRLGFGDVHHWSSRRLSGRPAPPA
ncbi:MAG: GNAT family N-acetyltransferase [Angustibacter sp.]